MSSGSCALCGEKFTNIFDAVNHTRKSGSEESFNPKITLGEGRRLGLGLLLNKIYLFSKDEYIKKQVEEAYSLIYISRMRPSAFPYIYDKFTDALESITPFDVRPLVYQIVSQEAFKEVGLF